MPESADHTGDNSFWKQWGYDYFTPERLKAAVKYWPVPRLGIPEDMAASVVFLASDRAGFLIRSPVAQIPSSESASLFFPPSYSSFVGFVLFFLGLHQVNRAEGALSRRRGCQVLQAGDQPACSSDHSTTLRLPSMIIMAGGTGARSASRPPLVMAVERPVADGDAVSTTRAPLGLSRTWSGSP